LVILRLDAELANWSPDFKNGALAWQPDRAQLDSRIGLIVAKLTEPPGGGGLLGTGNGTMVSVTFSVPQLTASRVIKRAILNMLFSFNFGVLTMSMLCF